MKKILSTLVLAFMALQSRAAYTLPAYESFPTNYANGVRLREIASFDAGNSLGNGSNLTNSWAAGLSFAGLVTSNNSGGVLANGFPSSGRDAGFQLNPSFTFSAATPALYASFLINILSPTTNTSLIALFSGGTGGGATPVAGVYLDSNNRLWISKSSATPSTNSTTSLTTSNTSLIVFRYKFSSTLPDEVALWINPTSGTFGADENNVPTATLVTTNGSDTASVASFILAHRVPGTIGASGSRFADEIRVATNWSGVTPPSGSVPPVETNSQPRITQSFLSGSNLVLRGTNGVTNGVYQVLSSSSVALPMTNWPAIATNLFDANGNFDSTNPVSIVEAQRYFRILVGGQIAQPPVNPPSITTQPTNIAALAGQTATFNAAANGTAPLAYQWFFNTSNILSGATSPSLTINNAQESNAGNYSLRVTNSAGSVTSVVATLTVNTPPSITTQPQSQAVTVSNAAAFSVIAAGDAPLTYQWHFASAPILDATNTTYSISSALTNNAGDYLVTVINPYGSVTSSVATLTVNPASTNTADFSLYGFGFPATGSGQLAETNANYRKVYTPGDLRLALANNATKVIEIMNDLNLGWNEIGATNQTGAFRANATPSMHPTLIASGVSLIDIQNKNGITIFSANGATIRHAEFNIKRSNNILIRNLKFDELWEWDEATKGDYDSKDWDFITIGDGDNCTNVWIDHCDFTKAYDGTVDLKGGANQVTVSWCRFLGDDGNSNSFVRQQFNHLETNGVSEAMFNFLRSNGFSIDDLVAVARSQKKGHLAGPTEFSADNNDIKLTLHHNYYLNHQDRLPRLRGGNAHVYNVYLNNTAARAAKIMRDAKVAAISGGLGSYKFDVTLNGAISTEDGAVLVEKCHLIDLTSPLRNNQVNAADASYTGKIRAEDTINTLNGSTFRGDTEDPGSTLVPVPAPLKPFSWNGFTNLPYTYPLNDPTNVASLVTNLSGQGVVNWNKTNWFKTTY